MTRTNDETGTNDAGKKRVGRFKKKDKKEREKRMTGRKGKMAPLRAVR